MLFHHIALPTDWESALETGEYRVSTRGRTIDEVGYMHGSFPDQVLGVAEAFYGDVEELLLLEIDGARTGAEVLVEEVPGAEKPFPHLYGPLPLAAVVAIHPLPRDAAGQFTFDEGDRASPDR